MAIGSLAQICIMNCCTFVKLILKHLHLCCRRVMGWLSYGGSRSCRRNGGSAAGPKHLLPLRWRPLPHHLVAQARSMTTRRSRAQRRRQQRAAVDSSASLKISRWSLVSNVGLFLLSLLVEFCGLVLLLFVDVVLVQTVSTASRFKSVCFSTYLSFLINSFLRQVLFCKPR